MINASYANAYKEVLVIINNLVRQDYERIPKEYIDFLKENCNSNYEFKYDVSKTFDEQKLLDETKYILFGLFEKFGATEKQKEMIKLFRSNYKNKLEEEMREKYNPEEIFKSKQNNTKISEEPKEKLEMIEYKDKKWYEKLFAKILKVFRKK